MKKIKNFLALCLVLLCSGGLWAQSLQLGAAKRDITPNPLLPVSGGIGTPQPATKQEGALSVRAMVLEKGATRVAIVNIDNLGWPAALGDLSRALIPDIPKENILIGSTHTHSGPDAYGFPNEKGETFADQSYLDFCVRQVADAVNEALATKQPVDLRMAVGEAKGKIAYNYYAPELYDPRCGVIQALGKTGNKKGEVIATLVNYAIHPEVIGAGRGILSPDLCGPLYDRIETKTGGMALFMNGAQGGMVTADNRLEGGKEANDYAECTRIGNLLADEALRIVSGAPLQTDPSLYITARSVDFLIDSPVMNYILSKSPLKYKIPKPGVARTQVNLVNIGSAQILTIPGEALPNIGYYLKRKMKGKQPFLFGLTNDAFGYILTEVDFNSFKRYEYVSRTSLGEQTGEIYIKEALELIQEAPAPDETKK
ncbi:hypothetical protein [Dyadobacter jejuensis]|nr:hypothetical protein [Dyadobacter jejuensis]